VGGAFLAALPAQTLTKTITYTRFLPPDNLRQVDFTYDAKMGTTAFGPPTTVASLPGADGVLFAPDETIIVGGQGNAVHRVLPSNGTYSTVNAGGVLSFHVMLDPSGSIVWTAGNLGSLGSVPLNPFANGTPHPLSGDDTEITHIVFANGRAYYSASGVLGMGNFGRIDMNTFATTRLFANVPWAHGMAFDCYTGDIAVFGGSYVAQFDPDTESVVSVLDASPLNLILDQGTSDGEGHLYIASNTGYMLFVDMTVSGLVGSPDFVDAPFLDVALDDIAPDCGLGSPPNGIRSQGYWRTHTDAWPLASLTLGCETYTKQQCLALMKTPPHGDASIILAVQLIAAKLNVANNSLDWPTITATIDAADALLCTLMGPLPYAVSAKAPPGSLMIPLAGQLEAYNTSGH
jgi:hypothetical protein